MAHNNKKASESKLAVKQTEMKSRVLFHNFWRTEKAWYLKS